MLRVVKLIWKPVEKLLLFIGRVNTVLLLSIFYYLILGPVAIGVKLVKIFSAKKGSQSSYWIARDMEPETEETLRRQF